MFLLRATLFLIFTMNVLKGNVAFIGDVSEAYYLLMKASAFVDNMGGGGNWCTACKRRFWFRRQAFCIIYACSTT